MNKTFKVVFNKARGALMVVNEATNSVQKKGTKTVIAAAVAAMIASFAGSAGATSSTSSTESHGPVGGSDIEITTPSTIVYPDNESRYAGIYLYGERDVKYTGEKFKINIDATKLSNVGVDNKAFSMSGMQIRNSKVVFASEQTSVIAKGLLGSSRWGSAFRADTGSKVQFIGRDVEIKGYSENYTIEALTAKVGSSISFDNTGDVYVEATSLASVTGVDAVGGSISFNNKGDVKIHSEILGNETGKINCIGIQTFINGSTLGKVSVTENVGKFDVEVIGQGVDDTHINNYSTGTVGIYVYDSSFSASNSVVNVKTYATSDLTVNPPSNYASKEAIGIRVFNYLNNTKGVFTTSSNTELNIDVQTGLVPSVGYGILAQNYSLSSSQYEVPAEALIQGKAKIEVQAERAYAVATSGYSNDEINNAKVTLLGDTTIKATGAEEAYGVKTDKGGIVTLGQAGKTVGITATSAKKAIAIYADGNTKLSTINLNGLTTITATNAIEGSGVVNVNNDLTLAGTTKAGAFTGNVNINAGTTALTADNGFWTKAKTTINQGATLAVAEIGTLATGASLTLAGGTLQTSVDQVLTVAKTVIDKDASKVIATENDSTSLKPRIVATSGTLVLTDEGYYTKDSLKAMSAALSSGSTMLDFTVAKLYKEEGQSSDLIDNVIQETESVVAKPTISTTNKSATVTVKNTGAATIVVDNTSTTGTQPTVESVVFDSPASTSTKLILVGEVENTPVVTLKSGEVPKELVFTNKVDVVFGSKNTEEETQGTLPKTTVHNAKFVNTKKTFDGLTTTGNVTLGDSESRGAVITPTLTVKSGSTVFLDPAWTGNAELDVIGNASHLEIVNAAQSTIAGNLIIGQNSLVTFGGTVAQASAGLDALKLAWGKDNVSAALYLGDKLTATGGVVVDGARTSAGTAAAGTVALANGSLLMINEATIGDQAIVGTLTAAGKAQVAVLNAADGKFKLADTVTGVTKVITDNQFVDGSIKSGVVTTDVNEQKLAGAVASLGIVQSARRADTVFANTIADRTAQSIAGEEVSLWADVGGERYEADDLDNKAQFKSNMFYGAFGADVGINPNVRIGAALQYGTGDSKSDNYSIKNDIDAVTLGLYGSYSFSESMKVVGEFAYTMSSNDIKSSERLLNNDVDADAFSLGVRGQYDYAVGAFRITPSVGLRLTRLCTDDFNVGAVKVDLDSQTLVQIPLSVAFSANIEKADWAVKPYAKVSFTPTFGDDEIKVRGYDQSALDTMPVQGDFGLSATNGKVTFGAALSAGFGQDGAKNFGGKVNVRYAF